MNENVKWFSVLHRLPCLTTKRLLFNDELISWAKEIAEVWASQTPEILSAGLNSKIRKQMSAKIMIGTHIRVAVVSYSFQPPLGSLICLFAWLLARMFSLAGGSSAGTGFLDMRLRWLTVLFQSRRHRCLNSRRYWSSFAISCNIQCGHQSGRNLPAIEEFVCPRRLVVIRKRRHM